MHPRGKLIGSLLLAAGVAFSQGRPSSLPQRSKMVTLNVVAFDNHGEPAVDLRSEEFQVSDQGKSQRIAFFRHTEDVPQLAAPPAADGSSKRAVPHPMVILFDLLNANLSNRGYGVDEIVHSLEHLESGDSVYLYLLTNSGSLYPVHALPTAEADAGAAKTPWTQQIRPLLDAAMNNVYGLRPVDDTQDNVRIETTYGAFETLASRMAPIPGRKNIIWITRGIPITIRLIGGEPYDYSRRLQRLATAVDQVGITVNSVDNGGVAGDAIYTLDQFAELTGGTVSTDLGKVISEVMNAARSSYLIQYAAPPPDGKYHKIRVTCSRKGIRIQTKQGYHAYT
jgi:VWFA-related protein